jgi:hypothetical protein
MKNKDITPPEEYNNLPVADSKEVEYTICLAKNSK